MSMTRREFMKRAGLTAAAAAPAASAIGSLLTGAKPASAACTVPTGTPSGPSKLSFHCELNWLDSTMEYMASQGAHFSVIKSCGDFGAVWSAKRWTPETVTIGRVVDNRDTFDDTGDPLTEAKEKMKASMVTWAKNRDAVDYWEVLNEPDPAKIAGHRRLGEFFMKCMEIAEKNGYKLAIMSYAVGVPEWEEFEALVKLGVFEMAKAGGHIFSCHEYNWGSQCRGWGDGLTPPDQTEYGSHAGYSDRGTLTGRYRWWYRDFLIPSNQVVPLIITESGWEPILANTQYPSSWNWRSHMWDSDGVGLQWIDDRMREDDYVLGSTLFTCGYYNGDMYTYFETERNQVRDHVISLKDA